MRYRIFLLLVTVTTLCDSVLSNPLSGADSLVVSTTEPSKKSDSAANGNDHHISPQIYYMEIQTNISNRYATTLVTSKVRNLKNVAAETTFSVILPENAFISQFVMEVGGKEYKAYVQEKEQAKRTYQEAVQRGQSAGHVELSARDSKTFTVSVNIEPRSKTIFRLTYEELLQRQIGQYELIVNIHPGQIVDNLSVKVHINESRPLKFVRTPSLRTGNEISKNDENLKPSTEIKIINSTAAIVKFSPDQEQQKTFAGLLGSEKESGLAGQFVVQYDVERDPQGGEVLVRDGYFVHFFSPSELEPLQKHVVFVLDHSGSMMGRKIEQLTDAMLNILSELANNDLFTIIRFSDLADIWSIEENKFITVQLAHQNYGHLEPQLRELRLPEAVQATKDNVDKAKNVIKNYGNLGLTNAIAGLEVGLFLIKKTQEKFPKKYQPMLIFLTDGLPNVGISSSEEIVNIVTKLNSGANRASIFSLSFGYGADKEFLKKLSTKNLGFSRHIYEAADASLQLQDFYRKISSPLLSNVTFKYVDDKVTDVTTSFYPIFFGGSELVVAGKIGDTLPEKFGFVGICGTGPIHFKPVKEEPVGPLERLWAYLTVKQILKDRDSATNKTELTKKALNLALKYSFVTPVSSLVVVKPNQTEAVEGKKSEAEGPYRSFGYQHHSVRLTPHRVYGGDPVNNHFLGSGDTQNRIGIRIGGNSFGSSGSHAAYPIFLSGPPGRPGPSPPRYYTSTPVTTPRPYQPTTHPNVPKWLQDLKDNNENITTSQGSFKLGYSGAISLRPDCPKTPLNGTGECTVIFDCPHVFALLNDFKTYLEYFCPLNEYAGICCPKSTASVIP